MTGPRRICTVCGGRRIPVDGVGRIHPNCYPDSVVLWSDPDRTAWLAARTEQNPTIPPSTTAVGATTGVSR